MELKVNRKELIEMLLIGGASAGKNRTTPITDNCKVTLKNGVMSVSSFDGQTAVVKRMNGLPLEAGNTSFCIIPSDVTNLLKTLSDDYVALSIVDNRCSVRHAKGVAEFSILPTDDFPSFVAGESEQTFTLPATIIMRWLYWGRNFAGNDEIRPIMSGLYLYIKNGEVGCCATNSHILLHDSFYDDNYRDIDVSAVIPVKSFGIILSVLADENIADVKVKIDDKSISVSTSDTKISCVRFSGNFPNFKAVIPSQYGIELTTNKKELLESVNRLSLFTGNNNATTLQTYYKTLRLSAVNLITQKSADDNLELTSHDGEEVKVCVDAKSFASCLSCVDSEKAIIKLNDSRHAMGIVDSIYENKIIIIMPILGN